MRTESCKTKDLEHNTGGNIKSVIDGILMIFITSPGMLYRVVYDVASSFMAKVSCVLVES